MPELFGKWHDSAMDAHTAASSNAMKAYVFLHNRSKNSYPYTDEQHALLNAENKADCALIYESVRNSTVTAASTAAKAIHDAVQSIDDIPVNTFNSNWDTLAKLTAVVVEQDHAQTHTSKNSLETLAKMAAVIKQDTRTLTFRISKETLAEMAAVVEQDTQALCNVVQDFDHYVQTTCPEDYDICYDALNAALITVKKSTHELWSAINDFSLWRKVNSTPITHAGGFFVLGILNMLMRLFKILIRRCLVLSAV